MPRDESSGLERSEAEGASAPLAVLLLAIALVLAVPWAYLWLRATPPIWHASVPPPTVHFCGRDYRDPVRRAERLPSDPTAVEPLVEAVDGERLQFPGVQSTRFNGFDVCTTVLQIHDAMGWVTYGLVGGP